MKKILFILFSLFSLSAIGQQYERVYVTDITGTDTTIYKRNGKHGLVTIDFTAVNSSTSTLDLGTSDDRVSFGSISVSDITFPVTLDKTTYTKTANGYTRNRIMFEDTDWKGTYVVFKLAKGTATSGFWDIWW